MDINKTIESLSLNEKKILPHLEEKDINAICKKSNLDKTSVLRSLEYLQNKGAVKLSQTKKKVVEIGINGALYKKKGLPERRLLNILSEKRIVPLKDAQKISGLSQEEFKASLGALRSKAMIEIHNGKIAFSAKKEEISKKSLEEQLIEALPIEYDSLTPEQLFALKTLQNRKGIVYILEQKTINLEITDFGKKLMNSKIKPENLIEQITPSILKSDKNWKGKKFRRYDVVSPVPAISGGKRHFVSQSIDYVRKVWTDMGFKEMTGNMVQSSFWVFDALFTAQDHPVRELQDTFYINKEMKLEDKKLTKTVKDTHEKGIAGSKGWRYQWDEKDAMKATLRTHTTCLSAQTLFALSKLPVEQRQGKFFRSKLDYLS